MVLCSKKTRKYGHTMVLNLGQPILFGDFESIYTINDRKLIKSGLKGGLKCVARPDPPPPCLHKRPFLYTFVPAKKQKIDYFQKFANVCKRVRAVLPTLVLYPPKFDILNFLVSVCCRSVFSVSSFSLSLSLSIYIYIYIYIYISIYIYIY